MIGVIAKESEWSAVEEFFELFKTPWERFDADHSYDAVLVSSPEANPASHSAAVLLICQSGGSALDTAAGFCLSRVVENEPMLLAGDPLPVYGRVAVFTGTAEVVATLKGSSGFCVGRRQIAGRTVIRLGYDLFEEAALLLSRGQPAANAAIPALDRHISMVRSLLVEAGVPVVEIPPTPSEASLIACLTHDIDFYSLRQHRFDHSMWGFLYRATVGTASDLIAGRRRFAAVVKNWQAACKLPLVHLRLCDDFWERQFDDYIRVESGKPSTFFIIPFKARPGKTAPDGRVNPKRATRYDISDIKEAARNLENAGCEVALHGIDAWTDRESAAEELNRIANVTGKAPAGVRMHWLYFSAGAPGILEEAHFDYDSTCGFNDAVGFRAGTSQVFKPLGNARLLELPMHIQDTALFYPGRMHLKEDAAWELCLAIIRKARENGGVLTLLWHDRSLAPERLWGGFYAALLNHLESAGAWFATASQVTAWFRKRRAVRFRSVRRTGSGVMVEMENVPAEAARDLTLRVMWLAGDGKVRKHETALAGRSTIDLSFSLNPRGSGMAEDGSHLERLAASLKETRVSALAN